MAEPGVLAYNLTLGLLAFFSPCGFPMLPAYIAYYLPREAAAPRPLARSFLAGLGGGLLAAAGALLVLLAIGGLAVALGAPFKERVLDLELVGGIVLVVLGTLMLVGRGPSLKIGMSPTRAKGAWGLVAFGALYAATASACVAPVLIGVLFPAFTAASPVDGLLQVLAYAAGLALLLVVVSVLIATAQERLVRAMRRVVPHVEKVMGTLLVAAGLYLAWYWAAVQFGIPAPPTLPAP